MRKSLILATVLLSIAAAPANAQDWQGIRGELGRQGDVETSFGAAGRDRATMHAMAMGFPRQPP